VDPTAPRCMAQANGIPASLMKSPRSEEIWRGLFCFGWPGPCSSRLGILRGVDTARATEERWRSGEVLGKGGPSSRQAVN
jgi:hypothetical protein